MVWGPSQQHLLATIFCENLRSERVKSGTKNGSGIRARFWSLLVLAQLPKAQKTGPFLGPHFGAREPLFLETRIRRAPQPLPLTYRILNLDSNPISNLLNVDFPFFFVLQLGFVRGF